jgi:amino acid permease
MSDKFRRIGAWAGIILLFGIYVVTLISAIFQKESTGGLFLASLFCTFVVPVWVFVLQAIYNRTHKDAVGKAEIAKMKQDAEKENIEA